ncbi:MFS transporter [Bombilactobacillus bombi]|uniref:MFS transporter n=1 Tax=Bombilactobacillus bombi TaxID=1303590 RepID=UPI0015E61EA3|nr:MFS transporter [Bombilactobacillus bombi]MBA1434223.1 MFS transporter [Bombilactobacillus bombi]
MEKKTQTPVKRGGMAMVIALMTGYSVIYMDKQMISAAVVPITQQFHLASQQAGFIMSAFFLAYCLMSIPAGWLVDKFGSKNILMLSMILTAVFAYAFGWSSGLLFFILMRFGSGVGHSGYPSAASKAIAENFDSDKRVFMQSAILTTTGIGAILAYAVGTRVIAINWRYGYVLLGTLFVVAFFFVTFFVPKDQKQVQAVTTTKKVGLGKVLKDPNVIVLALVLVLINVAAYGSSSWMVTFLTKSYHLSLKAAGNILAVNAIWQIVGSLGSGMVLTKWFAGQQKKFIVTTAAIGMLSTAVMVSVHNLLLVTVMLAISNLTIVATFTGSFTWSQRLFSKDRIGSATGILNFGGTFGGVIGPSLAGFLVDLFKGSFVVAFLVLGALLFVSGLLTLFIRAPKLENSN